MTIVPLTLGIYHSIKLDFDVMVICLGLIISHDRYS